MQLANTSFMLASGQQKGNVIELARDILKASLPKHPVLQRLSLKLNNKFDNNSLTTKYDRMAHRHSRS